jgi:membrane fusion protein (multidrug efflux system)
MAVDFLINEKQLTSFEMLEKRKQRPVDSLFTILLPNNSLYPFTGKISVIDRAVDPQTGSIRVRLEFPNRSYILKAGMSCIVRVHNIDSTPQLVVPGRAVVEQMGEYFVFVAKDSIPRSRADSLGKKGEDTTAEKTPRLFAYQKKISLGQTIGANVIVKDGLTEGEKIVVDGIQSLHDGSPISLGSRQGPRGSAGKDGDHGSDTNNERKMDSSKNN